MTEKEQNDFKRELELALLSKVDEKVKEKFDSFKQSVDTAYNFYSSTIKNSLWVVGIILTIISVVLGFLGFKTYSDIKDTIKLNVQKELSSDQVIAEYRNELSSLKLKLILDDLERNIAITNSYGNAYYRNLLSEDYLKIIREGLLKKDANSIRSLQVLNKYKDFEDEESRNSTKLNSDINRIRGNKEFVSQIYDISLDIKNPILQKEAFEFLISYGNNEQLENIVRQLKDYTINKNENVPSAFKDNAKDYITRLVFKIKSNRNSSIKRDIVSICNSSINNNDIELKIVGLMGLSALEGKGIENDVYKLITQSKENVDLLLGVLQTYSKYYYNRYSFDREKDQQVYNANFLSKIFEFWAQDKINKENYLYYNWLPLSSQPTLYNDLFKETIKRYRANKLNVLWVIKTFAPDDVFSFYESKLKYLPQLRAKINGKITDVYFDRFDRKLLDDNRQEIKIDSTLELSIKLKPNFNYAISDGSDDDF
jgi:ribosomal protein S17E